MPSVSRERIANVDDHGIVEDRHEDVDGTTISFVTIREDVDAAPLLRGLPDDRCSCPHWGYVFKGQLTYRFADHDEVFETGDAFYVPADHTNAVSADTEVVMFSPTEELAVTEAAIMRNMAAMQH